MRTKTILTAMAVLVGLGALACGLDFHLGGKILGTLGIAAPFLLFGIAEPAPSTPATPPATPPATLVPPVIPKNSKDLEGIRGFFAIIKDQFASAADVYGEPIKAQLEQVVKELEAALKALPATADANWSLASALDDLFRLLASADACVAMVSLELSKQKQQTASAGPAFVDAEIAAGRLMRKPDVDTLLAAEITKRTGESGDLIPRTLSTQLCSAAKETGIREGRAAIEAEHAQKAAQETKATERKTALTTAGLPLPDADVEKILRADDAAYKAAEDQAKARLEKFTKAGITLTPELQGKIWLGDSEFKVFESTVMGIPALRGKVSADEPLAGGPTGETPGKKMIV